MYFPPFTGQNENFENFSNFSNFSDLLKLSVLNFTEFFKSLNFTEFSVISTEPRFPTHHVGDDIESMWTLNIIVVTHTL